MDKTTDESYNLTEQQSILPENEIGNVSVSVCFIRQIEKNECTRSFPNYDTRAGASCSRSRAASTWNLGPGHGLQVDLVTTSGHGRLLDVLVEEVQVGEELASLGVDGAP